MKFKIGCSLVVFVKFSDQQWNLIMQAFKQHYDWGLKSAVEIGGWMYGLNNGRILSKGENKEAELTFRQADSILKSIELEFDSSACEIRLALHAILKKMNSTYELLNKQLDEEYETKIINSLI